MNWFRKFAFKLGKRALSIAGRPLGDPGLAYLFGPPASTSGVNVDDSSALAYTPFGAGVRAISAAVASLPCWVYKPGDTGAPVKQRKHPLTPLLQREPNSEQTRFTFFEAGQKDLLTRGNFYAEIEFDGGGKPFALWPLFDRVGRPEREKGKLRYPVNVGDSQPRYLDPSQLVHVLGFGDGIEGYNVVQGAREPIGLGLAAEKYGAGYYGRGAVPSGVLEHPGELGEEGRKNLEQSWSEGHEGLNRAHRLKILEEGMKYQKIAHSPEEAQALETRQFQVVETARVLDIPPHLLRDLSRATFSNIEHQGQEFVTYTLRAWLTRWELELGRKLLTKEEKQQGYFLEFDVSALLRGDMTTRFNAYSSAINAGWLNVDEVRSRENLPPAPNGEGSKFNRPTNLQPQQPARSKRSFNPDQDRAPDGKFGSGGGDAYPNGISDGKWEEHESEMKDLVDETSIADTVENLADELESGEKSAGDAADELATALTDPLTLFGEESSEEIGTRFAEIGDGLDDGADRDEANDEAYTLVEEMQAKTEALAQEITNRAEHAVDAVFGREASNSEAFGTFEIERERLLADFKAATDSVVDRPGDYGIAIEQDQSEESVDAARAELDDAGRDIHKAFDAFYDGMVDAAGAFCQTCADIYDERQPKRSRVLAYGNRLKLFQIRVAVKRSRREFSPDQPRDEDGKFGSGKDSPAEKSAFAKAKDTINKYKGKVDELINRVPVVGTVKQAVGKVVEKLHGKLADRYGSRTATAIMAAGQVADLATTAIGSVATGGLFAVPGLSLLGTIPAIAIAEGVHQYGKYKGRRSEETGVISEGDIHRLAVEFQGEVIAEFLRLCEEHKETILKQYEESNA